MGVDQRRLSCRSIIEHGARRTRSSRPSNARVNLATALLGGARWRSSPTQARQPFLTGTMRNTMLAVYVGLRCRSALLWAEWNIGVIFFSLHSIFIRATNELLSSTQCWLVYSSVGVYALGKAHTCFTPSQKFPNVAFTRVPVWVALTVSDRFWSFPQERTSSSPFHTTLAPFMPELNTVHWSFKLKCQVSFDKAACTRSFKLYNTIRLSYCHVMSIQLHWECFVVPRTLITHSRQS